MRIATWNVNSLSARLPRLLEWLAQVQPDVLCLQEIKMDSVDVPREELAALGYEIEAYGIGRWNGVAICSRVGITDVRRGLFDEPEYQSEVARVPEVEPRAIAATCGGLRLLTVYVPNGRGIDDPHYQYKLQWFAALRDTAARELVDHPDLVVLGDFNVVPTDADVWDVTQLHGGTHATEPERAGLRAILDVGLIDVRPRALKYDIPYTYWDYRAGMFHKNLGIRIDLVLATPRIADSVTDAYVDREARKGTAKSGKGPSDHAPIVVDLDRG
ncbi:exodeoxyribonuclease III [Millisia brevis]|uniref:exodeoxyribonuclease III n=1 Tax=Millisia brevis TaxID=264148 RepID=UPI00082E0940|nr:exodeoxyribonuclease III [Millisia brevis]